jgi:hypothetical protein
MPARTKPRSRYSPHPSLDYARNVVAKMKANTGRTLEEWIALARKKGPADEARRRLWLAEEHGLGTNQAAWVTERSLGRGEELLDDAKYLAEAERYVEELFAGPRAALRPIYERLLDEFARLDPDLRICPCQTMVPVFRRHAIAQVKPTTRTRVDLGLALGRHRGRLPARLIDTGGAAKKDRITHRIELRSPDEVDAGVRRWLKVAYELDGEQ